MYRFFAYTLGGIAILSFSIFAGVALYLYKLSQDLPDYGKLANYEPPITTRVFANDGSLIAEYARERRLFVPIESIPRRVIDAFLSAEDKDFYSHAGVDLNGVMRAAYSNLQNYLAKGGKRPEGASTITQQVAKNFLLTSELSLERKIKEWMLAFRLEDAYTKDKIIELYLNEIFLGSGSYGVAAAAYNYFDKSLDQLTIAETAYLAGLPKAPSNFHPVRNYKRAIERRNLDRVERRVTLVDEQLDLPLIRVARDDAAGSRRIRARHEHAAGFRERQLHRHHLREELRVDAGLIGGRSLNSSMQLIN